MFDIQAKNAKKVDMALERLEGQTVGMMENNSAILAGCMDITASEKAARFSLAFELSALASLSTSRINSGARGVIGKRAKLLPAYAEAIVPKITMIARKVYGEACNVMGHSEQARESRCKLLVSRGGDHGNVDRWGFPRNGEHRCAAQGFKPVFHLRCSLGPGVVAIKPVHLLQKEGLRRDTAEYTARFANLMWLHGRDTSMASSSRTILSALPAMICTYSIERWTHSHKSIRTFRFEGLFVEGIIVILFNS
ncbi:hypothetical protein ACHAWF_007512 [Thalassiosira exigua]